MAAGIPLGPYVLARRLASGGMAEIFLARKEGPEGFTRDLVVKRILPHLAEDPAFTEMFLEEARIAARLSHPNVVQVFDFGEVSGSYYLAMELVRGVDLRALILRARHVAMAQRRPGALAPHHAAKILSLACEGLAHAHALRVDGRRVGLVHRDVTPSNVLISFEGAVKVADFGIAKAELGKGRDERDDTGHGVVKGKYAYMSPEQARGERLDARSDLFNVGVLLFEAITGDTLFPHGDHRVAKVMSARGQIPEPERIDAMPAPLAHIVRRALSFERGDRYRDALALRAELETFLRGWPQPSDQVEIGRYVRALFPDVLQEDQRAPRAAGTVPATVAASAPVNVPGLGTLLADDEEAETDPTIDPVSAPSGAVVSGSGVLGSAVPGGAAAILPPTQPGTPTSLRTSDAPRADAAGPGEVRPKTLWALLAVALLAATGGGAYLALGDDGGPPRPDRTPVPPSRSELPPTAPPAELRIASEPLGEMVFVDDEPRGATPLMLELPSGVRHRVELRRDGQVVASEQVDLAAGEERELRLAVPTEPTRHGTLRIVTVPDGAEVSIDGERRGTTPLELEVAPGRYPVEVRAEGHRAQRGEAVVREPSEAVTLSFVLPAAPAAKRRGRATRERRASAPEPVETGTLIIATTPWSDVYLGGRKLGTTPLGNVQLPAGRHTLTLRAPGREPRRQPVTIRPNEETRVRLVL